jgi:hypothetical protein
MFFDWFGKNWTPNLKEPKPLWSYGPEFETEPQKSRKISSEDDLMTRAENIVWAMGFKGDIAGLEKSVYNTLKQYKKLDENVKDKV